MAFYAIMIHVGEGNGNHGTEWATATEGNMSKQAAEGLLNQFALQYRSRLFRGARIGRLVLERGELVASRES